jgi:hypothetical protein
VQKISSLRVGFPKPYKQYEVLGFFGHNIIVSEGQEWKKYRKISAPAFSDVSLFCWSIQILWLDLIIFSATTS